MAGYYDEISALMAPATSPTEDEDDQQDAGVSTLQQAGSAPDTGRYSQNGNELPQGLHTRNNPSNLPDSPLPSPESSTPSTIPTTGASNVSPDDEEKQRDSYADQGFQGQIRNLQIGDRAVRDLAGLPDEATTLKPLTDKLAHAQTPVNPNQAAYNPALPQGPGNMPGQENYRPSVGDRILRGVRGFARGGVLGAVDPKLVRVQGYGAPNDNYNREVAKRAQLAKSAADLIKIGQDAYKARVDQDKDVQTGAGNQSTGYSRLPTGVAAVRNAATEKVNATTAAQRAQQNSPEGKAAAKTAETRAELETTLTTRTANADRLGLKGNNREQYLLNGRVNFATPRSATEGEVQGSKALAAFKAEHGRGPNTLAEYADVMAASKGMESPEQRMSGRGRSQSIRQVSLELTSADKELKSATDSLNKTFKKEDRDAAKKKVEAAQAKKDAAMAKLQNIGNQPDQDDEEQPNAPATPPAAVPKPPPTVYKPAPPPGATSEVYDGDGKTLIGHMVGKRYVKLGAKK